MRLTPSKFGDIKITDSQASMNGLIYAPFGTVTIDCDYFNMDGLIIAQNVVVNSCGANINYSNSWAEFVGTDTEELSWSYDDWQYLADTDEDGLPNLIEKEIGTKPYKSASDGDLLPDGYEMLTLGTDPLKVDTDDNGISDYDEDFDEDGLSNGREYELGTQPYNGDTDGDTLTDGDEINTYSTNPLKVDTDKDGLNDDDEIYFGTDPNDSDSDDNGILDGSEKRLQTFTHKVENEDCAVTEVIVSMKGTGNLQKTTNVESVMNKDVLCTGVVGLVGEPFSIETTSKFDTATLTFKIDKSKLGDTEFDNLMFLWYDENENNFVELETTLDKDASTVSISTTHFSKYMLVDRTAWFDNWRKIYERFEGLCEINPSVTAICVDCSGSMSWNDPEFFDENGVETCFRNLAVENYINAMLGSDKTSIITFDSYAKELHGLSLKSTLTKNNIKFYSSGGTNANDAIKIAIEQLDKVFGNRSIILLSDGDVNVDDSKIKYAASNGILIHTIGLGWGADNYQLKQYSERTGGEHFIAANANDLEDIYDNLSETNQLNFDYLSDTDGDGVPDDIEISGIPLPNGKLVFTDPNEKHSDKDADHPEGDGLTDGDEIGKLVRETVAFWKPEEYVKYKFTFKIVSDPSNTDSDSDGLEDSYDPKCLFTINNGKNIQELDPKKQYNAYMLHIPNGVSPIYDIYRATKKDTEMSWEEFVDFYSIHYGFDFSLAEASKTELKIQAIQMCLESLGFLNMQGSKYGCMGAFTKKAIIDFQLNYGFRVPELEIIDGNYYFDIDDITFQTIVNVAVNNGFDPYEYNFPEKTYKTLCDLANVKITKNYFSYIPVSKPILNDFQISQGIGISEATMKIINNSTTIYTLDYTIPLNKLINKLSDYAENAKKHNEEMHSGKIELYLEFIGLVNHGKEWDIKRINSWRKTIPNISYYTEIFEFKYKNYYLNAEDLGNYIYGYTGNAFGFSQTELTLGSLFAAITSSTSDDENDKMWINKGYSDYEDQKQ